MSPLILIDWGTTRMRAFLSDGMKAMARCEGPGTSVLTGSPEGALRQAIQPWLNGSSGARIVMCGMAGSRNGLTEVPYAAVPIDVGTWLRSASARAVHDLNVLIAAGLQGTNPFGAPDVMRGEETQIFGALRRDSSLARGRRLFVLPGTHSKWVEVVDGAITRFQTLLTGELYGLLSDYSTLLRTGPSEGDAGDGFSAGVERSEATKTALQTAVFEARSAQLALGRPRNWAREFLSGLLIGLEIRQMHAAFVPVTEVILIGDPELRLRYRRVLVRYPVTVRELDGDQCAFEGLSVVASGNA
jgi:2-dehydro-3-deoxygalactonokinase